MSSFCCDSSAALHGDMVEERAYFCTRRGFTTVSTVSLPSTWVWVRIKEEDGINKCAITFILLLKLKVKYWVQPMSLISTDGSSTPTYRRWRSRCRSCSWSCELQLVIALSVSVTAAQARKHKYLEGDEVKRKLYGMSKGKTRSTGAFAFILVISSCIIVVWFISESEK